MDSILSIISELENEDLSQSSPAAIRSILNKLAMKPIPVLSTILEPGNTGINFIFRAREVDDFGEIKSEADLTYLRADKNKKYARATSPGNTMFYGTHLSFKSMKDIEKDIEKAAVGCLQEACCLFKDPPPKKEMKAVVGIWRLIDTLELNTVIDPVWEDNPTNRHRELVAKFDHVYSKRPEIIMDEAKAFHSFLFKHYNKSASSESDYWIPALITPDLIHPYDGLIYESVQCVDPLLNEVMCVAIKPESADRKLALFFVRAYTMKYIEGEGMLVSSTPFTLPTHQS